MKICFKTELKTYRIPHIYENSVPQEKDDWIIKRLIDIQAMNKMVTTDHINNNINDNNSNSNDYL